MSPARNSRRRLPLIIFGAVILIQMEGCYYMQAIRGHSDLMNRRRPVAEVIEDESSPGALKSKLELVREARDFAVTDLGLPDNESYRSYADLERDYVVWNVFAAPEFSLQAKTWCYPVAGCVAYRGYFSEESALKQGDKLRKQGFDVSIGGVAAYSTLGRFSDPVLNTMMRWSDVDLVATMFHELAHQMLYVKGDSGFNESFATLVAEVGVERWLNRTGELDRLDVYRQHLALRAEMQSLVSTTRDDLASLYQSGLADPEKRKRKREILDALSAEAQRLIDDDGRGVNNWLKAPLNNARLVSMNLYEGRVSAFKSILSACKDELACFYDRAAQLGAMRAADRNRELEALSD